MSAVEGAGELVGRDTAALAARWRERCTETLPGSPPSPSLARAVVAALADALRVPDGPGTTTAADLLRSSLEFDPDANVSVEQTALLREVLSRHLVLGLPPADAMPAIEGLGRALDALLVAVTDRAFRRLEAAAFLDPLTGVGNRRALDRDTAPLLATAQRHNRPISVIVIDLDGLKHINDSAGHAAGDDAIRRLASTLSRHLRTGDAVYRVGGDEFVLVLPETRPADVDPLLQRTIGQAPLFSFGVSGFPDDGLSLEELVDAADQQLLDGRRRTRGGNGRATADAVAPKEASTRPAPPEAARVQEPAPTSRPAATPWPVREIEERLYELPEVLAARVSEEGGALHVGLLVRPPAAAEQLRSAVLDRVREVAGAVPELLDLRVMPLGASAESVAVRATPPPPPAPAAKPVAPAPEVAGAAPDRRAAAPGRGRPTLARVAAIQEGANFSAEVTLREDGREVAGQASGVATRAGVQRLVAEATARGLTVLRGDGRARDVEFADVLDAGSGLIAVVAVAVEADRVLTGSAAVKGGNQLDAIARAVLDATNRT